MLSVTLLVEETREESFRIIVSAPHLSLLPPPRDALDLRSQSRQSPVVRTFREAGRTYPTIVNYLDMT